VGDTRDVVLVGGGGHATVLLDAVRSSGSWNVVGYIAPDESALSRLGVKWFGDDSHRASLLASGIKRAVLGVAGVRSNLKRSQIFSIWTNAGFSFVDVVHPKSTVSPSATHGAGLQVLAGAVINPGVKLGANVIVNTNATVEHDCEIGDHAHVAPGVTLCGAVVVGEGALIGAGSVVTPGVRIGRFALVGAGSSVVRDVGDETVALGRPARPVNAMRGGDR